MTAEHEMAFYLRVLGLSLVVGSLTFGAVLLVLTRKNPSVMATTADVQRFLSELDACTTRQKSQAACKPIATQAIAALDASSAAQYDFSRDSTFNVIVVERYIVMRRTGCSPEDLVVDEFHWKVWPMLVQNLPEGWKSSGFVGGVKKYSESGFTVGSNCFLVLTMPFRDLRSLEVGQYDRVASKWTWRVAGKV
jgi:hypothetical protein